MASRSQVRRRRARRRKEPRCMGPAIPLWGKPASIMSVFRYSGLLLKSVCSPGACTRWSKGRDAKCQPLCRTSGRGKRLRVSVRLYPQLTLVAELPPVLWTSARKLRHINFEGYNTINIALFGPSLLTHRCFKLRQR